MPSTPYRILEISTKDSSEFVLAFLDHGTARERFKIQLDYSDITKKFPIENISPDEQVFTLTLNPFMSAGPIHGPTIKSEKVTYLGNHNRMYLTTTKEVIIQYLEHGHYNVPVKSVPIKPSDIVFAIEENGETDSYRIVNNDLVNSFIIGRKLKSNRDPPNFT